MLQRRYMRAIVGPGLLILMGLVLLVVQAVQPGGQHDLAEYGLALMLGGIGFTNLVMIWRTREPADAMWQDGYDMGYRAGLEAGRAARSPRVVPMRPRSRDAG